MPWSSWQEFAVQDQVADSNHYSTNTFLKQIVIQTKYDLPNETIIYMYKLYKQEKTLQGTTAGPVFTNHSLEHSLSCSPDYSVCRNI